MEVPWRPGAIAGDAASIDKAADKDGPSLVDLHKGKGRYHANNVDKMVALSSYWQMYLRETHFMMHFPKMLPNMAPSGMKPTIAPKASPFGPPKL